MAHIQYKGDSLWVFSYSTSQIVEKDKVFVDHGAFCINAPDSDKATEYAQAFIDKTGMPKSTKLSKPYKLEIDLIRQYCEIVPDKRSKRK